MAGIPATCSGLYLTHVVLLLIRTLGDLRIQIMKRSVRGKERESFVWRPCPSIHPSVHLRPVPGITGWTICRIKSNICYLSAVCRRLRLVNVWFFALHSLYVWSCKRYFVHLYLSLPFPPPPHTRHPVLPTLKPNQSYSHTAKVVSHVITQSLSHVFFNSRPFLLS